MFIRKKLNELEIELKMLDHWIWRNPHLKIGSRSWKCKACSLLFCFFFLKYLFLNHGFQCFVPYWLLPLKVIQTFDLWNSKIIWPSISYQICSNFNSIKTNLISTLWDFFIIILRSLAHFLNTYSIYMNSKSYICITKWYNHWNIV